MDNYGFVKFQRALVNWEWYTEVNTCKLFFHCLLKVNYSTKKWQGITIKAGEFVTSLEKLAIETGLSVSKVRTALKKLESTQDVFVVTTMKHSKIRIADKHLENLITKSDLQKLDKLNSMPNNKQMANPSQANSKQIATTKNNKELKIENRIKRFKDQVYENTQYEKLILNSFFYYWSELGPDQTMRFENEKFWELKKRLAKWNANQKPSKTKKLTPKFNSNR
ncbi:hypothetical protein [Aestuariibaculum sediminum]|uniref:Uncharacterized protein n=1 Tax=Aestuariibaculum sediminum TaxID=2770637 RepID=A0A8J6PZS3_9FLAO|nr:hypothetical protein [Aestuariibaculum sediminum]MBD0831817.1 hypothetical protein [Aestuariibaculum sediminum]